jgi:DNA-binding NarL/FixJ family response regulator
LLLERQPGFHVVGQVTTFAEAIEVAATSRPQVILLELDPNHLERVDNVNKLAAVCGPVRLIGLARSDMIDAPIRAARLGAVGLISGNDSVEVMVKAIEKVFGGEVWFTRRMIGSILGELAHAGVAQDTVPSPESASLTKREREVVDLLAGGLKNRQIADRLFISEVTVRHHLTSVFAKLGVASRAELVAYAQAHRLARDRPTSQPLARSA